MLAVTAKASSTISTETAALSDEDRKHVIELVSLSKGGETILIPDQFEVAC